MIQNIISLFVILGCTCLVLYALYREAKIKNNKEQTDYIYSDDPK